MNNVVSRDVVAKRRRVHDLVQGALTSRRLPAWLAIVALLLSAPSLWLGLQNDDQFLRLALQHPAAGLEWDRGPLNLFAFYRSDPAVIHRMVDYGVAPWWTPSNFKIAFLRPLSGVTHWIDFTLWPDRPWLMHAHSIAWFISVVLVVTLLYRRLLSSRASRPADDASGGWVAGLAALLFTIDDAHGMPAMWIANRNATIAVLFAFLCIWAHHRWRTDGWRPGAVLAPLFLSAGLLGGETALGACAYVFAYALFLDRGSAARRLFTLAPSAAVVLAWSLAYRVLDYGVTGSSLYIDPGTNPIGFARAIAERAPLLLFGQFALPSAIHLLLSSTAGRIMWIASCAVVALVALLFAPLVARDRLSRFFAVGMLLAILPACGTFPDDRLLFLPGFGGMGLLAQFLVAMKQRSPLLPHPRAWRAAAWTALPPLVAIHVLFAPLSFVGTFNSIKSFGGLVERSGLSIPNDAALANQRLVVVNTPAAYISTVGLVLPRLAGRTMPAHLLVAGAGIYPTHVWRPAARSIVIHPEGGFLARSGSPQPGHERDQPAFDVRYMLPMFDGLYRSTPFKRGDRIPLSYVDIEVTEVTPDGRPDVVTYTFNVDLESSSLRWVQWRDGVYAPFRPPEVGQAVTLPAVTVPF